jgi:asparagine N-glycosylation enzyme membrane subunit Stt3
MSEDTSKRLRVVRFWLIGVFLIILAALIAFGFVFPGLFTEIFFWLGPIIAAVVFIAFYFLYKWWLGRK